MFTGTVVWNTELKKLDQEISGSGKEEKADGAAAEGEGEEAPEKIYRGDKDKYDERMHGLAARMYSKDDG